MSLQHISKVKKVVIKIGSNVLSSDTSLRKGFFRDLALQVSQLKKQGLDVILVSSGAIAVAMAEFKQYQKPKAISEKQAYAAYGQPLLINQYVQVFKKHKHKVAQILLTHDDLQNRRRFLNARHALQALLKKGIIPIVNENDTVAVEEIQFGDNDKLSSFVSHVVEADLLIILSHVDGLYDRDPSQHEGARLVKTVNTIDDFVRSFVFTGPSAKGAGGMVTKLEAAQFCMALGIPTFITSGMKKNCVLNLWKKKNPVGTFFVPQKDDLTSRQRWIGKVLQPKGKIVLDAGAVKALEKQKRSLLASGIRKVEGLFEKGECVTIETLRGRVIAKGLVSYSHFEIQKIKGKRSSQFEKLLGYKLADEVIHKDDLVLEKSLTK